MLDAPSHYGSAPVLGIILCRLVYINSITSTTFINLKWYCIRNENSTCSSCCKEDFVLLI